MIWVYCDVCVRVWRGECHVDVHDVAAIYRVLHMGTYESHVQNLRKDEVSIVVLLH